MSCIPRLLRIRLGRILRCADQWRADPHAASRPRSGDQRPGCLWRAPRPAGHLPDPYHRPSAYPFPDLHLTKYAASQPCEDFAETFHYYLRHKGRLPVRLANKPAILRKWQFMEWMAEKIARRS